MDETAVSGMLKTAQFSSPEVGEICKSGGWLSSEILLPPAFVQPFGLVAVTENRPPSETEMEAVFSEFDHKNDTPGVVEFAVIKMEVIAQSSTPEGGTTARSGTSKSCETGAEAVAVQPPGTVAVTA